MTPPTPRPNAGHRVVSALIEDFALRYRWRTLAIVGGLILAGLLDGLSVGALIPLITLADIGTRPPANAVERGFVEGLGGLGLAPTLPVLLGIVVVAVVGKAVTLLWANRQVGASVAHVTADMRRRFIDALLAAGWGFFASRELGRLANTLSSEAERSGRAYEALCQMAALAIQFLVYLALAMLVSWQISLAAALAGIVLVAATSRLIRGARLVGHRQTQVMQAMMARIADGLRGLKPLKAMAEESKLGQFLQANVAELNQAARKAVFYRQALDTLTEPLIVLFLAGGVVAAHQLWQIPLATQIVMALLFYRLITRVGGIQQHWQMVSLSESAYLSLRESIAAATGAREHAHGGIAPVLPATIRVEHAEFAYDEASVLEDVSLELRPGEITTIVGPSGSGKTTLADCIIGLRRVTAGRILIGDVDLERIDLIAWRRAIGYVPQEMFLFNQSLRANITLDDPALDDDAVQRALKRAGAADFVARLPQGLDTAMGEGGTRLSGGQRQRIAIARALVRQPSLLILDEATAALDPETEAGICATVRAQAEDRVVLAITHQPAWIAVADTVCRLDRGRLTIVKQREDRASGSGPARGRGGGAS